MRSCPFCFGNSCQVHFPTYYRRVISNIRHSAPIALTRRRLHKYSVGENAGFKLNTDGGIEIHVAAEKPAGVPKENWLAINRGDERIDLSLRIYAADLEKMKTWKAPSAVLVK